MDQQIPCDTYAMQFGLDSLYEATQRKWHNVCNF